MAGSLRRASAAVGAAVAGAAAAAARQEGLCASSLDSLHSGDAALRATASGLRQLHDAARLRVQGGAAPPAEPASSAGARRRYASAAEPAEAHAEGRPAGRGSGRGGGAAGSNGRSAPRFLLERLGRAGGQERAVAGRGGGRPPHGGPNGRPEPRAPGSGPPGSQPAQQPRNGRGGPPVRRPWRQAGEGAEASPQHSRGERQHQPHEARRPWGERQQQEGRQHPAQQRHSPEEQQQQRGREPHGRFPGRREAAPQPAQHRPERPPYQTVFEVPTEFPTEFPKAFPRAQPAGGKQKSKGAARQAQQVQQQEAPPEVTIPEDVTVLRLAQLLGADIARVEEVLEELGENVGSRHDLVSPDSAELAALEFGKIAVLASRGGRNAPLDADAVPRPAVVTVMGHVDHGKTTLLDALRKTSVAAGEAGGITQHIGAFEVQMPGSRQSLTFLDTPGHAAFTSMRARGAAVTDLVVLVVAADDGIMPQTREAISHARAAGCPIVVAITKCDSERADPARVRQQLVAAGLELEEVGGTIQVVEVAAVTGQGLGDLEEALLLQAELMELQASRSRRAEAVVIEAKVDRGQGTVATVVVKRGTLRVGQPMVVGTEWGRVRALRGTGGKPIAEALPGQPAEISGLKGLPQAGDQLLVVDSEERAQVISKARTSRSETLRRAAVARMLAEDEARRAAAGGGDGAAGGGEGGAPPAQRTLPVIIKADVQGSAEAVRDAVAHMCTEHVKVQVVHVGVGPVSHSDIQLAVPLGAKILGFNVGNAGGEVDKEAKRHGVEVRCQRVIYHLLEDVSGLLVGASPKVEHEVVAGAADVLQVFQLKGARGKEAGLVAGCRVAEGSIKASLKYRVLRGGEVVHTGRCASLKRHKLEVETVGKGTECGVLLEGFNDLRPGDVLQCVTTELRASAEVDTGPKNEWHLT